MSKTILGVFLLCLCMTPVQASDLADAVQRGDESQLPEKLGEADGNQAQADGMTPLHWAVRHRKPAVVARLLAAKADPNARTHYGVTPLAIAAETGDETLVSALCEAGADPNASGAGKVTPLILASHAGHVDVVRSLVDAGANVNATQRKGQTALMFAADAGHVPVMEVLLEAGAERDVTLSSGFNALLFAVRRGHREAAKHLIAAGADVNQVMRPKNSSGRNPRSGMTPIMIAVESAHYRMALDLVELGADPNDETSEFAPLHALTWVRRPQKGDNPEGDPPPSGSGTMTALQFARELVSAGADVNLQLRRGKRPRGRLNSRGATPFLMACQTVDLPYMETLLDLGANPNIANIDGCTALMAAAGVGNHHVGEHPGTPEEVEVAVRMLVDMGLDINAVDKHGETAMHGAAYRCFPQTVRLVALLGADPNVWDHKNSYGWTPLIIAKGYRPGSFKPDPPTIAAVEELLGERLATTAQDGKRLDWQAPEPESAAAAKTPRDAAKNADSK
ncbi:MAG: ankyrin repeat domain-containing protein [Planctomycetota bacterium]